MESYSLRDIRLSLPPEKNRADSLWTRAVLRPLSVPAAWVFLRLGVSANSVSYLSGLAALAGGTLLAAGAFVSPGLSRLSMVCGALLLNLFAVLDCADGNVARVTKTSGPWGGWADALGGYAAYAAVLLGSGMAAEAAALKTGPALIASFPAGSWVFLGALAAVANQFMRLAYQGYKNVRRDEAASEIAGEKKISENLGVTGLLMPAVLIGVVTGHLPYVVVFYALLYCGGCLVSVTKLILKVERLVRK